MTASTKDSQVSMRLPSGLKDRMETYSQLTGRSKSYVAMEALTEYLDWRLPQMQDLDEAIAAADRGEFATDAEVAAVFSRHGVKAAGEQAAPTAAPRAARKATLASAPKRGSASVAVRVAKPRRA